MLLMCDFQDVRRCGGGPHLLRCTYRTWQPSDVQNLATEVWKFPWESENSRSPSGISTQDCVCGLTDWLSGECLSLSAAAEIPELTVWLETERARGQLMGGTPCCVCSGILHFFPGVWAPGHMLGSQTGNGQGLPGAVGLGREGEPAKTVWLKSNNRFPFL